MTNAQALARKVALSVLKAYHAEIKSGFVSDASAIERERAQSAAFAEAESWLRIFAHQIPFAGSFESTDVFLNKRSEES